MTTIEKLIDLRKQAQKAVEDMTEIELKKKAFEIIFQHLIDSESDDANLLEDKKIITAKKKTDIVKENGGQKKEEAVNHAKIIELIKTVDEAEKIDKQILARNSQVDRTLLPLYIVHEYLENGFSLTSGDVSKICTDLGIPISQANASTTLSGTASKYVIGDKLRKKGGIVRYTLHRRGVEYLKSVIAGNSNENEA